MFESTQRLASISVARVAVHGITGAVYFRSKLYNFKLKLKWKLFSFLPVVKAATWWQSRICVSNMTFELIQI